MRAGRRDTAPGGTSGAARRCTGHGGAPLSRRALLAVGGWLAAAAATTVAGLWALSLAGDDLAGQAVRSMTLEEVERALATASAAPAVPPAAATGPSAATGGFSYAEGSVTAACDAGRALLLSWTPAPGHGVDEVERGPAPAVSVVFESDDRTTTVTVTCPSGAPAAEVRSAAEHDD
ncbi:hypothetical protein Ppa06_47800 [Planomonospora parontospora subsp. parontospora]|uniref:Septum formation initiator n=3 Tax=Planomonospora parontospora TaxID=58119 RepID=A0AA37BKD8_9ACTN|nr:hypothetical protein [Planomonospora parontospora]GGK82102.1 hypothetical protein GCM10010126_46800 [Planomonospora parontospora]GII10982.1 hypothetical protein Ppa06_47800 [Planomonospora parontospora subsp. parontospora]